MGRDQSNTGRLRDPVSVRQRQFIGGKGGPAVIIWLRLLGSFVVPCLIGYMILSALVGRRDFNVFMSVAVSFGLGLGVLTQCMFFIGMLGFKYSVITIISATIFIGFLVFLCRYRFRPLNITANGNALNMNDNYLLKNQNIFVKSFVILSFTFISYHIVCAFWLAMNIPIFTWDSLSTAAYNAQILTYERTLMGYKNFMHANHPLHIPMILTWISLNLGGWDDQLVKVVFPSVFVSFIIVFYYFLSRYVNKQWALLGVVMLFSSNLLVY